jgi:hypothetical protein
MKKLGCTDYSWIYNSSGTYGAPEKEIRQKVRDWCSIESNNLALWGGIMRYCLDRQNDNVILALISYNAGGGGLQSFLRKGGVPHNHHYIQGIRNKEYEANRILSA